MEGKKPKKMLDETVEDLQEELETLRHYLTEEELEAVVTKEKFKLRFIVCTEKEQLRKEKQTAQEKEVKTSNNNAHDLNSCTMRNKQIPKSEKIESSNLGDNLDYSCTSNKRIPKRPKRESSNFDDNLDDSCPSNKQIPKRPKKKSSNLDDNLDDSYPSKKQILKRPKIERRNLTGQHEETVGRGVAGYSLDQDSCTENKKPTISKIQSSNLDDSLDDSYPSKKQIRKRPKIERRNLTGQHEETVGKGVAGYSLDQDSCTDNKKPTISKIQSNNLGGQHEETVEKGAASYSLHHNSSQGDRKQIHRKIKKTNFGCQEAKTAGDDDALD